jgi:hypothetical protein
MVGMRALRFVSLVLLAVWIGGLLVLGAIVAPTTFAVVEAPRDGSGPTLAGLIVGAIFARFHPVAYGAGALLVVSLAARRLLGPKPLHFGVRLGAVCVMLAAALYSGFVLVPRIERAQAEINVPVASLPDGDPRRAGFERLHRLSTAVALVTILGGLVLIAYEAAES